MQDEYLKQKAGQNRGRKPERPRPLVERVVDWALRVWRPAGSVLAVALALLLTWHVISGKHGLSVWQQKRTENDLFPPSFQQT